MRAARVPAFGQPARVEEVPAPQPGTGESLVRIDAAVVAHLDRTIASGSFGMRPPLPYTPGVEGAATVVEGSTQPPGTRVIVRGAGVGVLRDGCWAELAAVPDRALAPVPADLPAPLAAAFFVPLVTAYLALHDVGRFRAPEAVLVTGAAGAVGSAVVQLALDAGAERVVAVVGRSSHGSVHGDERVEVVVATGDALSDALASGCPELAVDTVGGDTLTALLGRVPAGGRVAALGYTRGTDISLHLPDFLLRDVELRPVNGIRAERRGRSLAPHLASLLRSGRLTLDIEVFALEDLSSALNRLASGEARGRVVVVPGRS